MLGLGLVLLAALPPAISDPRLGPSPWAVVELRPGAEVPPASGYLVVVPPAVDQEWLGLLVGLAARAPVVSLGVPAEEVVVPYLDGVVVASREEAEALRRCCPGPALVGVAATPAEALEKLAWGVTSFLLPGQPAWAEAVEGAFPDPQPATGAGMALPTAGRSSDLAVLVGIPTGFPGGPVELPTAWVASIAQLWVDGEQQVLSVELVLDGAKVHLPPLASGGLLVLPRPVPPGGVEGVEVKAKRELTLEEVLARHHRQVAVQKRVVHGFTCWQRLRLRVLVRELDRSFQLELAGPAFFTPDLGRDWELREAMLDSTSWPVEELPELPLIQPKAPPVPPLALELAPSYRYRLLGRSVWEGREVFVLEFGREDGPVRRWGRAYLDVFTFGLVALESWQASPEDEVRRSRTLVRNRVLLHDGTPLWMPWKVEGDDTIASFGSTAALHRELILEDLQLNPRELERDRAEAWRGPRPMLREREGKVLPLEPDGRGGRREGGPRGKRQAFLVGGAFWDGSTAFPLPLLGYQLLDFRFRGDEQLRLFLAGAVNDLAWSRPGPWEPKAQVFLQLVPFSESPWQGERERKREELRSFRQKLRLGLVRQQGPWRLTAETGADVLHFARTSHTDPEFRLPRNTPEAVLQLEALWHRGEALLGARWEGGKRLRWERWGYGEPKEPRFWRGSLFARWEKNFGPAVKVTVGADLGTSRRADRFSRFALGGFGGGVAFSGLPGGRVRADELAVVKASLAVPWRGQRLELSGGGGWVGTREQGTNARPVAAVSLNLTRRGPRGTVLEASLGVPLVVPGPNHPVVRVVLLRPWR